MKHHLAMMGYVFILLFSIEGCGGASQHEPREEKTLYFVDAPTNGIDYTCGERRGITKTYTQQNGITKHGLFKCVYTPISFSLGKLKLGSIDKVVDGQTIYPQDLISSFNGNFNNTELLKMAILLQSLDNKSHPEYINISQETKEAIEIEELKELSIEELNSAIETMGFTPVDQKDARIHLILNSPNVHSGRPTITPFEEDISKNITIGDSIGELDISQGDGAFIYPFQLEGEGSEHFLLNNRGKLILTQTLDEAREYNLTVKISNEFGYSTAPLILHVKDSGKIGKAQMGRLKGATVKLFKLKENGEQELLNTTTTQSTGSLNQIGNFNLHSELLEDHSYYVYEVSGGVDIDSNDDGEEDATTTNNKGRLRLISKGIWIKSSAHKIRITPLCEMLYTYLERDGFKNLDTNIEKYAEVLLQKSLNSDYMIDGKDIIIFNPLKDKAKLYLTLSYNHVYNTITEQIRAGDNRYRNSLFNAYVVDSFQSNALEIVGSTVYTVDMMGSGEFTIYDLETRTKIGNLKLPYTPVKKDSHVIYLNLGDGDVTISSLSDFSYGVNIKNQKEITLTEEPFLGVSMLSGDFNRITIGKSKHQNIFSNERALYLYDMGENQNREKEIQFFHVNNPYFLYQFNSQLLNIESLWNYHNYLYVIGDNKMHVFIEEKNTMILVNIYNNRIIKGDILGIEKNILYILYKKELMLLDISSPKEPKFIETIHVPFSHKLGIKTNGKYITTGSKIFDIHALRFAKIAN